MGWRKEEVRNRNAENVRSLFFSYLFIFFFCVCSPNFDSSDLQSIYLEKTPVGSQHPTRKTEIPKEVVPLPGSVRFGSVSAPTAVAALFVFPSVRLRTNWITLHSRIIWRSRRVGPVSRSHAIRQKKTVNKKLKFFSCNSSESRVFAILNSIIWFDILSLHSVYKRLSTDPSAQDFSFRESIRPFLQSLSRKKFDLRPFVDIRRSFRSVNAPTGNDPLGES